MIGKSSSGPSAGEMAGAQSSANQQAMLQSLLGSQINQVTPFGKQTWSGSIPIVDPQTGQVSSYVNMPSAGNFQGGQTGSPSMPGQSSVSMPGQGAGGLITDWPDKYGPGAEIFYPENYPPGQGPGGQSGQSSQGMSGQDMSGQGPFSPRTLTTELSPHGQYMLQGQENIAKGLLDLASRTATQVQGQQAFDIGALGLPGLTDSVSPRGIADAGPIKRSVNSYEDKVQREIDVAGVPALPTLENYQGDIDAVESATFDRLARLLSPQFDRQTRDTRDYLATQGLPVGGEAYGRAIDDLSRNQNTAWQNAADQAVLAGRGEHSRLFGLGMGARQQGFGEKATMGDFANRAVAQMFGQGLGAGQFANQAQQQQLGQNQARSAQDFSQAMQAGQFGNQARSQGLNEALIQRQLPQTELAQLLGTMPVTPYPQFQPQGTFGMQAPDVMGAMNAQQNRQTGSQNALLGGLFSLGGSLLGNPGLF